MTTRISTGTSVQIDLDRGVVAPLRRHRVGPLVVADHDPDQQAQHEQRDDRDDRQQDRLWKQMASFAQRRHARLQVDRAVGVGWPKWSSAPGGGAPERRRRRPRGPRRPRPQSVKARLHVPSVCLAGRARERAILRRLRNRTRETRCATPDRPLRGGSIRASLGLAKAFGATPYRRAAARRTPVPSRTASAHAPEPRRRGRDPGEFDRLTNLTQAELRAWLETPQSRKVGMVRKGESRIRSAASRRGRSSRSAPPRSPT